MRRLFIGAAVPVFTIALLSGLTEIAFRIGFARSLDFNIEMWKYAVALKQPVANPLQGFVHRPSRHAFLMGVDVAISSQGLRDREYPLQKPPGSFRVLILGDSTTFGWGVREEDTVAKILERDLNHRPHALTFEVINAGVGNYNTVQEVESYKARWRQFHPDLTILQYFINDAEPVPEERHVFLLGQSYFVAFLLSRSDGLLRLTGTRPDWRSYYSSLYDDGRRGWVDAQAAIGELARETRFDGSLLLVALLPELHEIDRGYPFEREHAMVRAAAASAGAASIDLIDGLRGRGPEPSLWVTPLDAHPNRKANGLIAAQIQRWMIQHLLVRGSEPAS